MQTPIKAGKIAGIGKVTVATLIAAGFEFFEEAEGGAFVQSIGHEKANLINSWLTKNDDDVEQEGSEDEQPEPEKVSSEDEENDIEAESPEEVTSDDPVLKSAKRPLKLDLEDAEPGKWMDLTYLKELTDPQKLEYGMKMAEKNGVIIRRKEELSDYSKEHKAETGKIETEVDELARVMREGREEVNEHLFMVKNYKTKRYEYYDQFAELQHVIPFTSPVDYQRSLNLEDEKEENVEEEKVQEQDEAGEEEIGTEPED